MKCFAINRESFLNDNEDSRLYVCLCQGFLNPLKAESVPSDVCGSPTARLDLVLHAANRHIHKAYNPPSTLTLHQFLAHDPAQVNGGDCASFIRENHFDIQSRLHCGLAGMPTIVS